MADEGDGSDADDGLRGATDAFIAFEHEVDDEDTDGMMGFLVETTAANEDVVE